MKCVTTLEPYIYLQVWVGVLPVGPSGQALNSSYVNRDNPTYRQPGFF
jgi:hypothetical protein